MNFLVIFDELAVYYISCYNETYHIFTKDSFVLLISITIDDANKDIQAKHCFVKLEEVFSLFLCSSRYK